MDRLAKAALLAQLIEKMREARSWTGETHVQKAVFLLQEMLRVPTGFEFVLYKHGPFAFDLRDELTGLRADGLLDLEVQAPPYGPKLRSTEQGKMHRDRFPKMLQRYGKQIDFISQLLGGMQVGELERLATAFYATRRLGESASAQDRAAQLYAWKPHIPEDDAREAVTKIDSILAIPEVKRFRMEAEA